MFQSLSFDDGRGAYSEVIRARAPRGLWEAAKEVAKREGISAGELIRRAVLSYVNRSPTGSDKRPASGARD